MWRMAVVRRAMHVPTNQALSAPHLSGVGRKRRTDGPPGNVELLSAAASVAPTRASTIRTMGPFTFPRSTLAKDHYYVEGDSDSDDEVTASGFLAEKADDVAAQAVSLARRLRGMKPATTPMRR